MGIPDLIIWQDRFWEHTIRDENDLTNCFDYIHYNPEHHALVESPDLWKWSSYGEYYGDLPGNKLVIDHKLFEKEKWMYGE